MSDTPTFGTVENSPVATEPAKSSVFDLLKQEASKQIAKNRGFDVEARPGFRLEVNTLVDYSDFKRYQANAMKGSKDAMKADALLLATLVLAEYTTGIYYQGKQLTDEDGDPITFRSEGFIESFGEHTAAGTAAKFLGDGHAISISNKVLELAGYGAEVIELEDPTED